MRIYLGNKMVGKPKFNFPWFDSTAIQLREMPEVSDVFSPAERDRSIGFDVSDFHGTMAEMEKVGFSRRNALTVDVTWICNNSDGMVVGPDWTDSPGTKAEVALHQGLHLPVWRTKDFLKYGTNARTLPPMVPGRGIR
jgi:hypothetical protein